MYLLSASYFESTKQKCPLKKQIKGGKKAQEHFDEHRCPSHGFTKLSPDGVRKAVPQPLSRPVGDPAVGLRDPHVHPKALAQSGGSPGDPTWMLPKRHVLSAREIEPHVSSTKVLPMMQPDTQTAKVEN